MRKITRKVVGVTMLICAISLVGCMKEAKKETVEEKPIVAVSIVPEQRFILITCLYITGKLPQ
ncbi:MAG: hypothetical protein ACERKN_21320 [Velocimicrobium sp.]